MCHILIGQLLNAQSHRECSSLLGIWLFLCVCGGGHCSLPTHLEPTNGVWDSLHFTDDREERQRASGVYLQSHTDLRSTHK